jgi:hypothetical protein
MRTAPLLLVALASISSCACATERAPAPNPPPASPAAIEAPVVAPSSSAPSLPPVLPSSDAGALPAGFVSVAETGKTDCAGFTVEHFNDERDEHVRFVRVFGPDGRQHHEARGRERSDLHAEFCGDLTLDGVPELALTEKSLGAHCCYTHHLVSLTSPPKRLLRWERGDADFAVRPARYRPGAPWQLEGTAVFWPPFDPNEGDPIVSYADAPLVPAVLSLAGGEYRLMSFAFPDAYRCHRDGVRRACGAAWGCNNELVEWVDALLIGDWDIEKAGISDASLREQLDLRAAEARQKLVRELGSERKPARTH